MPILCHAGCFRFVSSRFVITIVMSIGDGAGSGQLKRHVQHGRHVGPHGEVDHEVRPHIRRGRYDQRDEEPPEEGEDQHAVQQVRDADSLTFLPLRNEDRINALATGGRTEWGTWRGKERTNTV